MNKLVFKRNNGGEIRGYDVVEPPKAVPTELTSIRPIELRGAGDAVKTPYTDEVGTKSAIQMYQDSGEVGGDSRLTPDMIRDTRMTQAELERASTNYNSPMTSREDYSQGKQSQQAMFQYEASLAKEDRNKLKSVQMKQRVKELHGEKFNEGVYDAVNRLTPLERREYIPDKGEGMDGVEYNSYSSSEAIYNTLAIEKHNYLADRRRNYDMDKGAFDNVISRFHAKSQLNELNNNYEIELQGAMLDLLNGRSVQELSEDERKEFDALANVDITELWGDEAKEWYTQIADYDAKLNYRPGLRSDNLDNMGYDESKFSDARKISRTTSSANDWLTENLGSLGGFAGDAVVSGGNLVSPEGSVASLLDNLSNHDLKGIETAAIEAGYDLVNILGLATLATGGGSLRAITQTISKLGYKGAIKYFQKGGWKLIQDKWKQIPRVARFGMVYPGAVGGVYEGGKFAYKHLTAEDDPSLYQSTIEKLGGEFATTTFGPKWKDTGNLKRLMEVNVDPTAVYPDIDNYLDRHSEWANISDAYNYFYPEQDVPLYLRRRYDTDYEMLGDTEAAKTIEDNNTI